MNTLYGPSIHFPFSAPLLVHAFLTYSKVPKTKTLNAKILGISKRPRSYFTRAFFAKRIMRSALVEVAVSVPKR